MNKSFYFPTFISKNIYNVGFMFMCGVNPNGGEISQCFRMTLLSKVANILLKQHIFSFAVISARTYTGGRKLSQLALELPSE